MVTALLFGPGGNLDARLAACLPVAAARGSELVVFVTTADDREGKRAEALHGGDAPPVANDVRRGFDRAFTEDGWRARAAADEAETESERSDGRVRAELRLVGADRVRTALAAALGDLQATALVICVDEVESEDAESTQMLHDLLRLIACELVYVRPGPASANGSSGVLVAVARGPQSENAVRFARALADARGLSLTAMHVHPDTGSEAAGVAERVLDRTLRAALGGGAEAVERVVAVGDDVTAAVLDACRQRACGYFVCGASDAVIEGARRRKTLGKSVARALPEPTVVLVRRPERLTRRAKRWVERVAQRFVPQLARDDRIVLVDQVLSGSAWNFDFVALLSLSALIATLGLIGDSSAAIIGAMLVAPLMTPLLGVGLALVQGNPVLARTGIRSVALGFVTALALAILAGIATPEFERPTGEMLARDWPDVIDLWIAAVAGLAAAYASARPGLLAALPGVAIAVALLPPIATSGLAVSLGDWNLALGAALLFCVNMVTIVLASAFALWLVGLRTAPKASIATRYIARVLGVSTIVIASFLLAVRPAYTPPTRTPPELSAAIVEHLPAEFRLDDLTIERWHTDWRVFARVRGPSAVPRAVAESMLAAARTTLGRAVDLRVETILELDLR